jgi:hypothetical protein
VWSLNGIKRLKVYEVVAIEKRWVQLTTEAK